MGHSISMSPQASSVLRMQLQEEAHGLRHLNQEKVLPQQNLVVSLEARRPAAWGEGQQESGIRGGRPGTLPSTHQPHFSPPGQAQHQCQGASILSTKSSGGSWGWEAGGSRRPTEGGRRGPAGLGPCLLCLVPLQVGVEWEELSGEGGQQLEHLYLWPLHP